MYFSLKVLFLILLLLSYQTWYFKKIRIKWAMDKKMCLLWIIGPSNCFTYVASENSKLYYLPTQVLLMEIMQSLFLFRESFSLQCAIECKNYAFIKGVHITFNSIIVLFTFFLTLFIVHLKCIFVIVITKLGTN